MQRINLDTIRKATNLDIKVFIRTGEKAFSTIGASITTNGIPFNLTGYTVNFEGANQNGKFSGGSATIVNATNGQIEYTFTPTDAAVEGWFEYAYFVVKKGSTIEGTTEGFQVHVSRRVDIDDEQIGAGVNALQETINALESSFNTWKGNREADYSALQTQANGLSTKLNTVGTDLTGKVTAAQTALNTTKNDALSAVTTAHNDLDDAMEQFAAADFYNKAEMNSKLNLKVDKTTYTSLYTTAEAAIAPMAGFTEYNTSASSGNFPMAIRRFGVVTTKGAFKNTNTINLSDAQDVVNMGLLPAGYRPKRDLNFVAQGTNMNRYLVTVTTAGTITAARYGSGASPTSIPAGSWLNIGMTFVAAE